MPGTRIYGPSGAPGTAGALAQNTSGATNPQLPSTTAVTTTTETVLINQALGTSPLVLNVPCNNPFEGIPFKVIASGKVKTGASLNVTTKLYSGTSATVGSDTLIKASSAQAVNGTSNWWIIAKLVYDSTSGKLNGTVQFMIDNAITAEAAVTNVVTSVSNAGPGGGLPTLSFVLSVTFGTANAANQITVNDFAVYDSV